MSKRILTVQDISCIGRCSMAVALPVLSVCGLETALLPTAILSTHTGFPSPSFHDLTEELPAIVSHWKEQAFSFDGFYSGYLGSVSQVRLIRDLFVQLRQDVGSPIFVDPVMGDHGKLYSGFSQAYADEMRSLCAIADVILPNRTEACALAGVPYQAHMTEEEQIRLAQALCAFGCKAVILTGAEFSDGETGALLYDGVQKTVSVAKTEKLPVQYHGTGDLFASTVAGLSVRGMALSDAMEIAVDFVSVCMRATQESADDIRCGVEFERALPWLVNRLETK